MWDLEYLLQASVFSVLNEEFWDGKKVPTIIPYVSQLPMLRLGPRSSAAFLSQAESGDIVGLQSGKEFLLRDLLPKQ